jgi:hypothetical protein
MTGSLREKKGLCMAQHCPNYPGIRIKGTAAFIVILIVAAFVSKQNFEIFLLFPFRSQFSNPVPYLPLQIIYEQIL